MPSKSKLGKIWLKCGVVIVCAALACVNFPAWSQSSSNSLSIRLGERLFRDARFSTSQGDLPASCSSCHLFDEDPQGTRAFADFFNRSWISFRTQLPQRFELRNSPALFDVAKMPRLHFDGEFASLEDLVKGTFSGRPMGWLPEEKDQALAQLQAVVLQDHGDESGKENYREQFKKAYNVELEKLSRAEVVNLVARAIADFMRTLNSPMNSPYDQFVKLNKLEAALANGESIQEFSKRGLAKISELEQAKTLRLTKGFDRTALAGLKIFFDPATGNCVTCHALPLFTDNLFHNLGISQIEYDQIHGAGKFATLNIPGAAEAVRPTTQWREIPISSKPENVDLGYWNFVNLKTSVLRRANESDEQFLPRMIGTFKTPGLRHLASTYPYMHNGAYTTLTDAINEIRRLSEMARAGEIRAADEELKKIKLTEADITALIVFLNTLNEDLKRSYSVSMTK